MWFILSSNILDHSIENTIQVQYSQVCITFICAMCYLKLIIYGVYGILT